MWVNVSTRLLEQQSVEAHLILATLAQCVTFELVQGQRVATEPLVMLRPKNGIRMIVHRRKDAEAADGASSAVISGQQAH
jgi:hypothetical protein